MSNPSRYRILESLVRGGVGEVFLAENTQIWRNALAVWNAEGRLCGWHHRTRSHTFRCV